jgi:hypothetical protein
MNAHEIVAIATRFHVDTRQADSPWIDVTEAARRARCGVKLLYREIRAGRLQAARVGGRREPDCHSTAKWGATSTARRRRSRRPSGFGSRFGAERFAL